MLAVLSPSKSLDFESKLPKTRQTLPRLLDGSMRLAAVMKTKSVAELARMSHISGELAALNAQRWTEFAPPFTEKVARPAVLAFTGDLYQGLAPRDRFATGDYTEAQKTIRILSGLYGVLRPLDFATELNVQPFWAKTVAEYFAICRSLGSANRVSDEVVPCVP